MTQLRQAAWSFPGPTKESIGVVLEMSKGQLRVRSVQQGSLAERFKLPIGAYLFSVGEQPVVGMTAAQVQKLMRKALSKGPMKLNLRFHENAMVGVVKSIDGIEVSQEAVADRRQSVGMTRQQTFQFGDFSRVKKEIVKKGTRWQRLVKRSRFLQMLSADNTAAENIKGFDFFGGQLEQK